MEISDDFFDISFDEMFDFSQEGTDALENSLIRNNNNERDTLINESQLHVDHHKPSNNDHNSGKSYKFGLKGDNSQNNKMSSRRFPSLPQNEVASSQKDIFRLNNTSIDSDSSSKSISNQANVDEKNKQFTGQEKKSIAISQRKNNKSRENYGKGPEVEYLKANFPRYNVHYKKCEIYKRLGKPNKTRIIQLGKEYNVRFKEEIQMELLPKFNRYHKRNMDIAVWFFQDNINYIYSWLKSSRKLIY